MGKKRVEEFNPWPPFVDIFSSVILVLLLFLLITIVNIAYYAQFKFKVSYTGTIATNELILQNSTSQVSKKEKIDVKIDDPIEKTEDIGDIQSAGKDLSRIYEDDNTKQKIISSDDYLVINFGSNTIKLDDPIIVQIKDFIAKVKKKYPNHIVQVSAVDPTNQISATVMKQISLARTLNARNLVRKLNYKRKDVQVDLLNPKSLNINNKNEFGYLILKVEKK
ncbi:hypothetical protein [Arcobacter sp. F2176]|uniref:hypothetical protein n=1 Tax=unclassified Arcobacter TaxID=2593671 RepID=UPI00100B2FA0|nr:hypothetical protein [Arcobacter sp. F2176]RXJ80155.1 hypothetical protein CRU95_11775 [Arcobacter sp. F2176]